MAGWLGGCVGGWLAGWLAGWWAVWVGGYVEGSGWAGGWVGAGMWVALTVGYTWCALTVWPSRGPVHLDTSKKGLSIDATICPRLWFHQLSVEPQGGTDYGAICGPVFGTTFRPTGCCLHRMVISISRASRVHNGLNSKFAPFRYTVAWQGQAGRN